VSLLAEQPLPDVQARCDERGVALDHVGISGLRYPAVVECADGSSQQTICQAQLSVTLAAPVRGTHMSRLVEALHESHAAISPGGVLSMARELAERLDVNAAAIKLAYPLFIARTAPITGQQALLGIDCALDVRFGPDGTQLHVEARVPITSLCPCSKEIADYSAHSQRGYVTINVHDARWVDGDVGLWPEDLVAVCDHAASAPVYPLLKRPDERHVTMLAYEHPAFVEDVAREVALALQADERIAGFDLEVVNHESIHDHQAFAALAWRRT
jgi:GTP cyclohydrolase I